MYLVAILCLFTSGNKHLTAYLVLIFCISVSLKNQTDSLQLVQSNQSLLKKELHCLYTTPGMQQNASNPTKNQRHFCQNIYYDTGN